MATRDAFIGGGAAVDTNNPFSGAGTQTTAMTVAPQVGYAVRLPNGQSIMFNSEADFLKMKDFMAAQQQNTPTLGGSSGGSSGGDFLGMAVDGFQAVSGFLAGSRYSQLLQDLQDARDAMASAKDALSKEPSTSPQMLNAMTAMQDYQDAGINVLNAQITAVDMAAGGETAKVISRFVSGSGGGGGLMGGGMGSTVAIGAAGLGLGLLLSNNNSSTRRR